MVWEWYEEPEQRAGISTALVLFATVAAHGANNERLAVCELLWICNAVRGIASIVSANSGHGPHGCPQLADLAAQGA